MTKQCGNCQRCFYDPVKKERVCGITGKSKDKQDEPCEYWERKKY